MSNQKATEVLLEICGGCKENEKILIVTDPTSQAIALELWATAERFKNRSLIMMPETTMHGENPTELVGAAMQEADVIFGCTKFSLFHAQAKKDAVRKGARFVNMADYSPEMLISGGLYCDFIANGKICAHIAEALNGKKICRITTPKGTDFVCSIEGRNSTPQYGRSLNPGESSSPPDIECATCALEGTGDGIVYIDGSIPHPRLGLINEDIKLTIQAGVIKKIEGGEQANILKSVLENFNDPNVYKVGEIGIGLNPNCSLSGRMLEDEGCSGTVHFGCGDNRGFGGLTQSPFHLDLIFCEPTLTVDDVTVLKNGVVAL